MQAAAGQLTFLVGGSDRALEAATPVLKAMSKEIVHLASPEVELGPECRRCVCE